MGIDNVIKIGKEVRKENDQERNIFFIKVRPIDQDTAWFNVVAGKFFFYYPAAQVNLMAMGAKKKAATAPAGSVKFSEEEAGRVTVTENEKDTPKNSNETDIKRLM